MLPQNVNGDLAAGSRYNRLCPTNMSTTIDKETRFYEALERGWDNGSLFKIPLNRIRASVLERGNFASGSLMSIVCKNNELLEGIFLADKRPYEQTSVGVFWVHLLKLLGDIRYAEHIYVELLSCRDYY